jgi:hypothetical protein
MKLHDEDFAIDTTTLFRRTARASLPRRARGSGERAFAPARNGNGIVLSFILEHIDARNG